MHSSPIDDGDRVLLFSIIRDITDDLAARAALATSEEQFRVLAESIGDVAIVHDANGRIRWVSPSVRRVLGLDPDALVGTPMSALMHPEDAHDPSTHLDDASKGGETACRVRWRHADGTIRWMDARTTFRADSGQFAGGYSVVRDVDAQVHVLADLARSEQRFRTAMDGADRDGGGDPGRRVR